MTAAPFFSVYREDFENKSCWKLVDNQSGHRVTILPFLGGAISSFTVQGADGQVELIDGYRNMEEIADGVETAFKGCNLFPYPNRVAGGRYRLGTEMLELPINFPLENNAIHGLIYKLPFQIEEKTENEDGCTLTLGYLQHEALSCYPFNFELKTTYSLSRSHGFTCATTITNTSPQSMPMGQGWHPYYTVAATSIDELNIQLPTVEQIELDSGKIPTGSVLTGTRFTSPEALVNITLDDCYRLASGTGRAEVILENPKTELRLHLWQEKGADKYNYLQIYTPPNRTSIAVEPMSCPPNALNSGDGLIILKPGESADLCWGILVNPAN